MNDETEIIEKPQAVSETTSQKTITETTVSGPPKPDQSTILNVSVRAWLAILVIYTLCMMAVNQIKVEEPFYTISIAVVSVFFVQSPKPKTQLQ